MANRLIRINDATLATYDQDSIRKEYEYDGVKYTLVGTQVLSVPDYIATAWVAHDSTVEVVTNPTA